MTSLINETADFQVVGEVSSGPEAVRVALAQQPDLVLMDVHMPEGGGVEAVRQLREARPDLPVLMLTVSEKDGDLLEAIRAGARGYLLKNVDPEDLLKALRQAAVGQAVIDPALTERLFHHLQSSAANSSLSLRETEILQLVAEGCTNREIATRLYVSENTVKTHIARILGKLDVTTRSQAVSLAHARGWLPT